MLPTSDLESFKVRIDALDEMEERDDVERLPMTICAACLSRNSSLDRTACMSRFVAERLFDIVDAPERTEGLALW